MATGPEAPPTTSPRAEAPAPGGSPYRSPAAVDPAIPSDLPRPVSFRARSFRPGRRAFVLLGSLLAHAALLGVSALSAAGGAAAHSQTAPRPRFHSGAFLVHAESVPVGCDSRPSEALTACFDRSTLDARYLFTSPSEAYGYDARSPVSWERVPFPFMVLGTDDRSEREIAESMLEDDLGQCANTAREAGWSGKGRVFVRVGHEKDGGAVAQVLPLDSEADHPGLLCCVRKSQLALASAMRPGTTVRYTLTDDTSAGLTLTPPPL